MDLEPRNAPRTGDDLLSMARAFSELGDLLKRPDLTPLDALLAVALDRIGGTEAASITTLAGGTFRTPAATDEWARQADHLQYELGSGPCVDAVVEDTVYRPEDLLHDTRWQAFGQRVNAEFGVRSMLSFRLHLDATDTIAGLNLYSRQFAAFDEKAELVGLLLATHGAVAVAAVLSRSRIANLEQALKSNRDIGTAVGILMASHQLTQQQAFDLLSVASQRSNLKLYLVAQRVVETGALEITGGAGTRSAQERSPK